jgi:hypothetical protein
LSTEDQKQSENPDAERTEDRSAISNFAANEKPSDEQKKQAGGKIKGFLYRRRYHLRQSLRRIAEAIGDPRTWLELIALAVVICYTYYAREQSITMTNTLREVQKQTGFAQTAANATKNAADTARDALELSERAYLNLGKVRISPQGIAMPIENIGRLSAPRVWVHVTRVIDKNPVKKGTSIEKVFDLGGDRTPVAPGTDRDGVTVPWDDIKSHIPSFTDETETLTVYGKIHYEIGFNTTDKKPVPKTDDLFFCYTFNPKNMAAFDHCPILKFEDLSKLPAPKPDKKQR